MTGHQSQGLIAQGPLPAGMLRIQQGSQERYVWPVHLPGWLGLGWRVAGTDARADARAEATAVTPSDGIAAVESPTPIAATASGLIEQDDAKPASTRGRRGRRRKDEAQPEAPADTGASTINDGSDAVAPEPSSEPAQHSEPPAAAIEVPNPDTTAEAPVLTALPDDLFSDPLI
ncbi:MAG: hypothetical protein ACK55E_03430 [Cyanobacteriota bacterium]|jgi:hypothetical protein